MSLFTILLLLSSALLCSGAKIYDSIQLAIDDIENLAEQGDADAQNNLGLMYANGTGVAEDDVEAVKWYRKAAEQGLAAAQNNLGYMYRAGEGVVEDATEGVKWYRKAAEQGHAMAQTVLGLAYGTGGGVPEDYVVAYMWLNIAAAQGIEPAKKAKDLIAARMTIEQIAEAQKLSREWLAKRSR